MRIVIDKETAQMKRKRNTVQRQIIHNTLIKMNSHPTVEGVYSTVYKDHPSISRATVYRNLRKLAEDGKIRELSIPGGVERYDERADQHYHFKCKRCGGVYDVDIDYIDGIDGTVQRKYGMKVDKHDVVFTGVCAGCGEMGALGPAQG